jgi:hypothetical protein
MSRFTYASRLKSCLEHNRLYFVAKMMDETMFICQKIRGSTDAEAPASRIPK